MEDAQLMIFQREKKTLQGLIFRPFMLYFHKESDCITCPENLNEAK